MCIYTTNSVSRELWDKKEMHDIVSNVRHFQSSWRNQTYSWEEIARDKTLALLSDPCQEPPPQKTSPASLWP